MTTVTEHYESLLADHYTWLYGGWEGGTEENRRFFAAHGIAPSGNGRAVDLGCGSGFQSIALAEAGFSVIAMDLSPKLLRELALHKGNLAIQTIQDDVLQLSKHLNGPAELCVCMGDTLTHLESRETIQDLFQQVSSALDIGGKFILTFRDLSFELKDLERFIPVQSEPNRIFTCFLEYEPEYVKVHDLVHERVDEKWVFSKSMYRKCRVPFEWVKEALSVLGFYLQLASLEKGVASIIAVKK